MLTCFIFNFAGIISYKYVDNTGELTTVDLTCTLNDEEYYFSVTYDEQYSDADILIAQIEDYFTDRGGEVIISE